MKTTQNLFEKPANMSHPQWCYAMAKAASETADAANDERTKPYFDRITVDITDEQYQALCQEMENDAELTRIGQRAVTFQKLLRQAEDVLIDWGRSECERLARQHGRDWSVLRQAFDSPRSREYPHRDKLVDICFKLGGAS